MRIVFIGAGNLATNLAEALIRAGHDVLQVYSRTADSADAFGDAYECSAFTDINKIRCDADAYIFALKDDALVGVATQLAERVKDKLFVHTAGSMPMDVLPVEHRGVLYPMQTFSKKRITDFKHIPTFIEASTDADLQTLRQLAESITDRVTEMSSADRVYLHLGAVFCCNFTNRMYALAEKMLEEHGIPFEVMLPLIKETSCKVEKMSPRKAQTGPAIRWDENVIQKHLEMLDSEVDMKQIYSMLSENIHKEYM
ncbi:MAG: F420-dependent NADP oxidoreductase [Bacteroidaceae bacterium]|nr:F420-dependent NADP oxidoreductase [Bacteroidaceae bacterium]